MNTEFNVIQKFQKETQNLLESLQEGIVVIKDGEIAFLNSIFKNLFPRHENYLDYELFKVYTKQEGEDDV